MTGLLTHVATHSRTIPQNSDEEQLQILFGEVSRVLQEEQAYFILRMNRTLTRLAHNDQILVSVLTEE